MRPEGCLCDVILRYMRARLETEKALQLELAAELKRRPSTDIAEVVDAFGLAQRRVDALELGIRIAGQVHQVEPHHKPPSVMS